MPWDNQDQLKAFREARLLLRRPEWKRLEAVSLTTGGAHQIVRAFVEDFVESEEPNCSGQRILLTDFFVEQVRSFTSLPETSCANFLTMVDEKVQLDFRISGLKGRTLSTNSMDLVSAGRNVTHFTLESPV